MTIVENWNAFCERIAQIQKAVDRRIAPALKASKQAEAQAKKDGRIT